MEALLSTESNNSAPFDKNMFQEQALEKMEAILSQAAMGIHVLFDKATIADAYKNNPSIRRGN